MNSQQRTWYRAGGDIAARAGFSLAMCGALAGVLYLTSNDRSQGGAVTSAGNPPQVATILASEGDAGLSEPQIAVDASPGFMPAAAQIPVAVQRLAEIGPVPAKRPVSPVKRTGKEHVALASNVVHFETCLPDCETRDPQIVGNSEKAAQSAVSPLPSDELVQDLSYNERTPSVLASALDAPGAVYRKGRNVLTTLVRAAL